VKVHNLQMIRVIPRRGCRPFQVHPSHAYHRKRWWLDLPTLRRLDTADCGMKNKTKLININVMTFKPKFINSLRDYGFGNCLDCIDTNVTFSCSVELTELNVVVVESSNLDLFRGSL
jgi:hypothetical protein